MTARRDSGFTLLEVLIAVGLMGLVFTVVSAAFVVSVDSTRDSGAALEQSQAGTLTSAYWTRDVQSAAEVSGSTPRCPAQPGPLVASLRWTDHVAGTAQGVDYRLADGALVRHRCGSTVSRDVVGRELTAVVLTCAPSSTCRRATLRLTGSLGPVHTVSADRRLP